MFKKYYHTRIIMDLVIGSIYYREVGTNKLIVTANMEIAYDCN